MKKITALSIALTMLLSFASCSSGNGGSAEAEVTTAKSETVEADTEKEEITEKPKTEETESVSETSEETSSSSITEQIKNRVELDMSNIKEFPTGKYGSEIACAVLLLNYLGFDATEETLLPHMPIMEKPNEDGTWTTPYNRYLGVPGESRYGAWHMVVVDTIKSYFSENNINEYKAIYYNYGGNIADIQSIIDNNFPLIIWATKDMKAGNPTETIVVDDILEFDWVTDTQCFLVIGYDTEAENLILFDPYNENQIVEYSYDNVLLSAKDLDYQIVQPENK